MLSFHAIFLVREILEDSPLVVVQGARQVGKSTLLRQAVPAQTSYAVTLDDPLERDFAQRDPAGFLSQAPGKTLVIDEAQRVPSLALELKRTIDADRRPGRFAMTGSSDLLRTPGVSDSLAGRAEFLRVYPFSPGELARRSTPEDWVAWIISGKRSTGSHYSGGDELRKAVIEGGYPVPVQRQGAQRKTRWFSSYLQSLIEHDATELFGGGQFARHLEGLLKYLAGQGQTELVKAKTARALGISETAFTDYLQLAQRMYLVDSTPGWGIGFTNRAVKRPKIAIADSGLASFLSGLTVDNSRLAGGAELFGSILEGFVVSELRKQASWSSECFTVHHFRERNSEVDAVIELADSRLILIEVKSAVRVVERAWRILDDIGARLGDRVIAKVVFYAGEAAKTISSGRVPLHVLPVSTLWQHGE